MSRDLTSDDWMEEILAPRRKELELLERLLHYVQKTAHLEGRAYARAQAEKKED